ncbi:Glutaredoxin-2 [Serratia rubidaea]|uniref:Glutaredoxin-2 n=1 Tax=Serratia rubidaea TaxID=61652 RepID=A0A447QVN6_SERRU|nr:Glutaredoxin-2 [Serratia rubidaea]
MKLFIYDHCPFCVKARMIFGLQGKPVRLVTLLNDDEITPTTMIGKKMAPILQKDDGSYLPESMDIVHYIDRLDGKPLLTGPATRSLANGWRRRRNIRRNCCCRASPRPTLKSSPPTTPASTLLIRSRRQSAISPAIWPTAPTLSPGWNRICRRWRR